MNIQIIVLPQTTHEMEKVLVRSTTHSAGYDVVYQGPDRVIEPGATVTIETGIFIAIPHGYEGQIRPRSSMGLKGIIIPNSPGTIDSDFRGEIKIILLNLSGKEYTGRRPKIPTELPKLYFRR
jgi:dUTP pyrophosphatase